MVCLSHFRKMAAKLLTLEMNSSPLFTVSTWTVCFSSHACMHTIAGRKKKIQTVAKPQVRQPEREEGERGLEGHPSRWLVHIVASQCWQGFGDLLVQFIVREAGRSEAS